MGGIAKKGSITGKKPEGLLWRREEAGQTRYGSDLPELLDISLYIMSFINPTPLYSSCVIRLSTAATASTAFINPITLHDVTNIITHPAV